MQSLVRILISGIYNPAVGLHEHCRAEVVLTVPPVAGAGGLARPAEHAFIQSVNLVSVLLALVVLLLAWFFGSLALEVGVDALVLVVEVSHIDDQVLQHEHEHQR